jgi:hypothetical protein
MQLLVKKSEGCPRSSRDDETLTENGDTCDARKENAQTSTAERQAEAQRRE